MERLRYFWKFCASLTNLPELEKQVRDQIHGHKFVVCLQKDRNDQNWFNHSWFGLKGWRFIIFGMTIESQEATQVLVSFLAGSGTPGAKFCNAMLPQWHNVGRRWKKSMIMYMIMMYVMGSFPFLWPRCNIFMLQVLLIWQQIFFRSTFWIFMKQFATSQIPRILFDSHSKEVRMNFS